MRPLTRFTCEEAFRRLDDYLDRELSAVEMGLVREHLEVCAGCASEFRFEDSVLQGVRTKLRQIDLPDDLQARVLRLLQVTRDGEGEGKEQGDAGPLAVP